MKTINLTAIEYALREENRFPFNKMLSESQLIAIIHLIGHSGLIHNRLLVVFLYGTSLRQNFKHNDLRERKVILQ